MEKIEQKARKSPQSLTFDEACRGTILMNKTIERPAVEHYRYSVEWSASDGEFVATIAEFDDMLESGEEVPEPLADRTYSGRVNLRMDPAVHRKSATEALRHGTSLNAYATRLLDQ